MLNDGITVIATMDGEANISNGLFDSYQPPAGAYDEIRDADGKFREHWSKAIAMFQGIPTADFQSRCQQVHRYVGDLGLSHRIYTEHATIDKLAMPDCIPLILKQSEWEKIGNGLKQRAKMLELMIRDIYGPMRLVHEKIIPPEIIYANPMFLRPLVGIEPIANRYLHVYAADILRNTDGQWTVIADRTQSPSGAGIALEHRRAMVRFFPEFLRNCSVHGILPYIANFRSGLNNYAPNTQDPRVVLLTPGPYHESYFEHTLLCKLFGYTLAEGGDLVVRGSKVYLKVLDGLQPVDLILRRVDDLYCDPLELNPDSILAPPGIVESVRNKTVGIVNALGTGIGHTPALLPFFPSICRFLLGEELISRTVPTWWCGHKEPRDYVLANLNKLVIKPALPSRMFDPVFCNTLTEDQLAEMRQKIIMSPEKYVAQEQISGSTMPILIDSALQPARIQMRCFLSAENDDYTLLPGGAVRYSEFDGSNIISVQAGAGSKDAWIISEDENNQSDEGITARGSQVIQRTTGSIPSRVADNFYWIGRQVDRIESCVRFARMLLMRVSDQQTDSLSPELQRLLETLSFGWLPRGTSARSVIIGHLFDPSSVFGLRPAVRELQRLARGSRDLLGADLFRVIREIDDATNVYFDPPTSPDPSTVMETLNKLIMHLASFHGLISESMTHTPSWRFLDMGRRIERATEMVRMLNATLVDGSLDESTILSAVLESTDCPLTYRQQYFSVPHTEAVADLLVNDADNPRSVLYSALNILSHLKELPRSASEPLSPLRRTVQKLVSSCELHDMIDLCKPNGKKQRDQFAAALNYLRDKLKLIADLITQSFFSHAIVRQQKNLIGEAGKP